MQREYFLVVNELERQCSTYFCNRLVSAYIHGSVDKEDAIYGVSDLDYYLIVSDCIKAEDYEWQNNVIEQLQNQFDVVDEVHLTIQSVKGLKDDPFTRFILSYNATLRMGKRIESIPEYHSCEWYCPNKYLAKMRLSFARKCFEEALEQKTPACTGEIPNNVYYAARKLARYFVIVEGAYFLMTRNKFCGFDKKVVLSGLNEEASAFQDVLKMTEFVLSDPLRAQIDQETFLQTVQALIEWMFQEIQYA